VAASSQDETRIGKATVLAMVALGLAVFAIANDFTAMSVALPTIEADFDTDVSTVQWVVNGYALIFGVLIVPGGRLADMFGRRLILFIGAGIFATFSLLGGLAPSIWILILARLLMGIGGAMMWPAILGLFYAILPASRAALAGGIIMGVAGIGNAAGPLVGGFLTQELDWRWILVLNVPIALIACLVTWRCVGIDDPAEQSKVDYLGILTLSTGLIALLVALGQAPDEGWTDPMVIGLLVISALALVAFGFRERAAGENGLVPPSVLANRPFLMVCLAVLSLSTIFFASLFYLPQFFQKILDYDALGSGLAMLPMLGTFALASFLAGSLVRRLGIKAVISVGALAMASGTFLLLFLLDGSSGFASFVPGMIVLGLGIGLFVSCATTAGVTSLDESQSSLAGGILYMFQVAGGALGLGLTTTVFLAGSNRTIDDGATDAGVDLTASEIASVRGVVAGTDTSAEVLAHYSGDVAAQLVDAVRNSFVTGLRWALLFDGVLALIGLAITVFKVAGPISRFGRDQEVETAG
jgi:EmrB/QacA subfamily drug resistance transporter